MLEQLSNTHYRIHGRLTMQEDLGAIAGLLDMLEGNKTTLTQFQLDLGDITEADSILLAIIIAIARSVEARQGVLRISGFPDRFRSLAKTYGVDVLIGHYMAYPHTTESA